MNVIIEQAERRKARLSTISKAIREAFDKDQDVQFDKLVNMACVEFGASKRYALELIEVTLGGMPHKIEKGLDGKKLICPYIITAKNEQKLSTEEEDILSNGVDEKTEAKADLARKNEEGDTKFEK